MMRPVDVFLEANSKTLHGGPTSPVVNSSRRGVGETGKHCLPPSHILIFPGRPLVGD